MVEAARTGACVTVVQAFDVDGRADLTLEWDLGQARRDARYRTQSWVVEVLGDLGVSVPVLVSTPDGSVEEALVSAADGAQMVVIGRPHGGRNRDLAQNLARRSECPVLAVAANHDTDVTTPY